MHNSLDLLRISVSLVLAREDLAGKVKDGKWARKVDGSAAGDNGKVPAADETEETETTSSLDEGLDVRDIGSGRGMRNGEISSSGEGEETDQTEEGDGEESIDTEAADEEDKGDEGPATDQYGVSQRVLMSLHGDIVEALRRVVCSTIAGTEFSRKSGYGWVKRVLVVRETAPMASVDDEDSTWES